MKERSDGEPEPIVAYPIGVYTVACTTCLKPAGERCTAVLNFPAGITLSHAHDARVETYRRTQGDNTPAGRPPR